MCNCFGKSKVIVALQWKKVCKDIDLSECDCAMGVLFVTRRAPTPLSDKEWLVVQYDPMLKNDTFVLGYFWTLESAMIFSEYLLLKF